MVAATERVMRYYGVQVDANELADFYQRLLGWPIGAEDPTWATLRPAGGGAGLSFQLEPDHVPPVWPATADRRRPIRRT